MDNNLEKMKALSKKFREPCGRTIGHGDSCSKGWYCGACSDKAKAADLIDELIAEVERLRARFGYIEGNATTSGGGHGFEVRFFVPEDSEDIGCGIDAAIAAHTKG